MIHQRFLDKLGEIESKFTDEDKLARVENLKRGEKNTIDQLKRKKDELLRTVGLDNFIED